MRRAAVIDMGSNSFRLVVYGYEPGRYWQHVDEIREVRRTTWGFNVARVDAADEAVFVDLGSSSQFDELLAVLQGLRTVGPFPVEGVRRRVRPSPDATFDSSDAQR